MSKQFSLYRSLKKIQTLSCNVCILCSNSKINKTVFKSKLKFWTIKEIWNRQFMDFCKIILPYYGPRKMAEKITK